MERFLPSCWAPSWLRHEHVGRYEWARQFCEGGAAQVNAFDISQDSIEEARERFSQNDRVHFDVADVTKLPLADHQIDLYISFETIEHVDDDRSVLAEALRVLKPGGKFICSTPNREVVNPGNALRDPPGNPYHIREYAHDELDSLLREFFSDVEWFGQTFLPERYCRLLTALGRINRKIARRVHQVQKVCGSIWRTAQSHYPDNLRLNRVPEVLIAVCTNPVI